MAPALSGPAEPLPRWVRWFAAPAAAVLLTGLFVIAGFPYRELARRIEYHAERDLGMPLAIGGLYPTLGLAGPAFGSRDLQLTLPSGERFVLDSLELRPAWSLSWFRLVPAIHVDATSPIGNAEGTLVIGSERGFDGRLEDVELSELPLGALLRGFGLRGRVDADADLRSVPGAPVEGRLEFEASEGSFTLPNMPIAIPYDTLRGDVALGSGQMATIESMTLEGPMVSGDIAGTIGNAPQPGMGRLDLSARFEMHQPEMQGALRGLGVRAGRDGKATLKVSGTLARPDIR